MTTPSVDQALRKAKSLAKKGATGEAESLLRSTLQRFPDNKRLQDGLRSLAGNRATPQRGTTLTPQVAQELLGLYNRGRARDALDKARALAAKNPQATFLRNFIGTCHVALGEPDQAVASYERALAHAAAKDAASIHKNMAVALLALNQHEKAIDHLKKALKTFPDDLECLNNLGSSLSVLGRSDEALEPLDRALSLKNDFVEALVNRGNARNHLGQRKAAIADMEKALELQPGHAEAFRMLSIIKTYEPDDPQIAAMESALTAAKPGEKIHLHFALGKAFEDTGDTEKSFEHYAAGNALRRAELADPVENERRLMARIRELFKDGVPAPLQAKPARRRPVFILGMPRSGTSLIEQILASHPAVVGGGELDALRRACTPALEGGRTDSASLLQLRTAYLGSIDTLGGDEPVVTDKMPLNFRWIGFIASALPEATIIHVKRDPVAIGWSIFKKHFTAKGMQFSFALSDIAAYYRLYEEIMAFWEERLPGRIYDLDYQALTENQEAETRKLLDACGLEWDERCMAFHETERAVITASAAQVREKMYTGSSDAWRRYEAHLRPLIDGLKA